MRLRNTTDIPDDRVREIIRFVRPPGISKFDVMVRNSAAAWGGKAYWNGSPWHRNMDNGKRHPFVVCRIGEHAPVKLPARFVGMKDTWLLTREEILVMLLAHELRHLWQAKRKNRAGYYPRTRGRFSEVDCDCYALAKVRQWRRR